MATNAVLNVDKLLQVFLWVGRGEGEMVRTPSRNLISSVRGGIASALEEESGAQKDLAPNLTSRQGQDCDLSLDLQDAVCGLPIIRPVLLGLGSDTATFLHTMAWSLGLALPSDMSGCLWATAPTLSLCLP